MRPEYRNSIDDKYKRKVEAVIRKPNKSPDPAEPETPCPFCNTPVPIMSMSCSQCKSTLPYCIASGQHLVKDDWTVCPNCKFPAISSQLMEVFDLTVLSSSSFR